EVRSEMLVGRELSHREPLAARARAREDLLAGPARIALRERMAEVDDASGALGREGEGERRGERESEDERERAPHGHLQAIAGDKPDEPLAEDYVSAAARGKRVSYDLRAWTTRPAARRWRAPPPRPPRRGPGPPPR